MIDPIGLAVDVAATLRVARLASHDVITDPIRDAIFEAGQDGHGVARWVDELLDCPWCVSVWSTALVFGLHRIRGGRHVVRGLAVAEVTGVLLAAGPVPIRMGERR